MCVCECEECESASFSLVRGCRGGELDPAARNGSWEGNVPLVEAFKEGGRVERRSSEWRVVSRGGKGGIKGAGPGRAGKITVVGRV